jgi:PmbA protein
MALMKFTGSELADICHQVLTQSKKIGASDAEASASCDAGLDMSVRLGAVENVEHYQNQSLSLTVYVDKKTGSASTTDLSAKAIAMVVQKAVTIAQQTQNDPCTGLADPELLAKTIPDCDLDHPWEITLPELISKAIECEALAMAQDPRLSNSDGVSIDTGRRISAYANSLDFSGYYASSLHQASCTVVAKEQGQMQRDGDYTVARDAKDLLAFQHLAENAAQKTLRRLGARKVNTCKVPVIFHHELARGLWRQLFSAISGSAIYRQASFLAGKLDQPILPNFITLSQKPHILKGLGSAPFDDDGVATHDRDFVADGILRSYLMGTYSARKLGLKSTGNAGGLQNCFVTHSDQDLAALCKTMGTGFLATELIGSGVNLVTGDYSRGAFGYWVENGVIQHAVEGITLAGNLSDMFLNLVAVANDIDTRGSLQTGSVLLHEMTLAGQ